MRPQARRQPPPFEGPSPFPVPPPRWNKETAITTNNQQAARRLPLQQHAPAQTPQRPPRQPQPAPPRRRRYAPRPSAYQSDRQARHHPEDQARHPQRGPGHRPTQPRPAASTDEATSTAERSRRASATARQPDLLIKDLYDLSPTSTDPTGLTRRRAVTIFTVLNKTAFHTEPGRLIALNLAKQLVNDLERQGQPTEQQDAPRQQRRNHPDQDHSQSLAPSRSPVLTNNTNVSVNNLAKQLYLADIAIAILLVIALLHSACNWTLAILGQ